MPDSVVSVDRMRDETGSQRFFASHFLLSSSLIIVIAAVLLFIVRSKLPGVGNLPYWILALGTVLFFLSWFIDRPLGVWRRWPVVASSAGLRRPRGGVPTRVAVYPTGINSVCFVTAQESISEDSWRTALPLISSGFGFNRATIEFKKWGKLVVLSLTNKPSPIDVACDMPVNRKGKSVLVGVDELGRDFWLDIEGNSAGVVGGIPGSGKSFFLKRLALSYSLDPETHVLIFDPKDDSDFSSLARIRSNIHHYPGNPTDPEILQLLEKLLKVLQKRARSSRTEWPLLFIIIDECQEFVSISKGVTSEEKKARERSLFIIRELIRKGRSLGFFTILATQRMGAEAIPTSIRDLAGIRCSGKLRTRENEVMVFGESNGLTFGLEKGQMVVEDGRDLAKVRVATDARYQALTAPPPKK